MSIPFSCTETFRLALKSIQGSESNQLKRYWSNVPEQTLTKRVISLLQENATKSRYVNKTNLELVVNINSARLSDQKGRVVAEEDPSIYRTIAGIKTVK